MQEEMSKNAINKSIVNATQPCGYNPQNMSVQRYKKIAQTQRFMQFLLILFQNQGKIL